MRALADTSWANTRLRQLVAERDALTASLDAVEPPPLDSTSVMAYRRQTERSMASGQAAERKRLLRVWVNEMKVEPASLEVKISYRLPEAVMKSVVAGPSFKPETGDPGPSRGFAPTGDPLHITFPNIATPVQKPILKGLHHDHGLERLKVQTRKRESAFFADHKLPLAQRASNLSNCGKLTYSGWDFPSGSWGWCN